MGRLKAVQAVLQIFQPSPLSLSLFTVLGGLFGMHRYVRLTLKAIAGHTRPCLAKVSNANGTACRIVDDEVVGDCLCASLCCPHASVWFIMP